MRDDEFAGLRVWEGLECFGGCGGRADGGDDGCVGSKKEDGSQSETDACVC